MNRRPARLLLVMTTTTLLAVPGAAAAADEIGLSRDGRTWSAELAEPLFDPAFRWVPGDVETASFLVRNQAADTGDLTIDVIGTRVDTLLETGDLEVATRAGDGDWVAVSEPGTHRLSRTTVAAGAQERVDVRVSFDPASTNASQLTQLALRFTVRLSDSRAGSDAGAGLLPDTGAPRVAGLLVVAVGAVVGGLVLASRKENRRG